MKVRLPSRTVVQMSFRFDSKQRPIAAVQVRRNRCDAVSAKRSLTSAGMLASVNFESRQLKLNKAGFWGHINLLCVSAVSVAAARPRRIRSTSGLAER